MTTTTKTTRRARARTTYDLWLIEQLLPFGEGWYTRESATSADEAAHVVASRRRAWPGKWRTRKIRVPYAM